jgi:hypothetical protein
MRAFEHSDPSGRHDLTPRARDVGVVAWCSFLAAGAGAMTLFAFVDPGQLQLEGLPGLWRNRLALYAIGFFVLWGMSALAATLTLYMVRTSR